ncbi:hypothetical protein [Hyphomicrobium sp.]|uniref:hypothetical protein n=1 Tax=Hyphomicrobium sp. TaxID=82 RepID=UPI003F7086B9
MARPAHLQILHEVDRLIARHQQRVLHQQARVSEAMRVGENEQNERQMLNVLQEVLRLEEDYRRLVITALAKRWKL